MKFEENGKSGPQKMSEKESVAKPDQEIKKLKKMNSSLEKHKYMLQSAFESLKNTIIILDEKGKIAYKNKAWDDFIRKSGFELREAGIGSDYFEICRQIGGKGVKKIIKGVKSVIAGEADECVQEYCCYSSEKKHWFLMRAQPFLGGGSFAVIISNEEITEKRKTEENYQNLIENLPDIVVRFNRDFSPVFINSAITNEVELAVEEVIKDPEQLSLPEENVKKWDQNLEKLFQSGENIQFEMKSPGEDKTKYHEITIVPEFDDQGMVETALAIIHDITEKKKLQKKLELQTTYFKQLFSNSPDAIVLLDNEIKVLKVNNSFERLFGFESEEAAGRNINNLLVPEKFQKEGKLLSDKVLAGGEIKGKETIRKAKSGRRIQVEITAYPIILKGDQLGIYVNYRDITRRKLSEKKLERKTEKLTDLTERFESLIDLIANIKCYHVIPEKNFLSLLFDELIELVPEADYGSIHYFGDDEWEILNAAGHNKEQLQELELNRANIYQPHKKGVVKIYNREKIYSKFPETSIQKIKQALKPVKETVFINLDLDDELIGRFYLDIAVTNEQTFSEEAIEILQSFARLTVTVLTVKKYEKMEENSFRKLVIAFVKLLEIYDPYTENHSRKVAGLVTKIAYKMNLDRNTIRKSYWASMVHDVGKVLIPRRILKKEESLTEPEYMTVKNHPVWAFQALKESGKLEDIADYVLYHHERWDGQGYPEGLTGKDIPLVSRIINVADAWQAMRSPRAYRKALSREEAVKELRKEKGKQFAPDVVDVLLEIIGDLRGGADE